MYSLRNWNFCFIAAATFQTSLHFLNCTATVVESFSQIRNTLWGPSIFSQAPCQSHPCATSDWLIQCLCARGLSLEPPFLPDKTAPWQVSLCLSKLADMSHYLSLVSHWALSSLVHIYIYTCNFLVFLHTIRAATLGRGQTEHGGQKGHSTKGRNLDHKVQVTGSHKTGDNIVREPNCSV